MSFPVWCVANARARSRMLADGTGSTPGEIGIVGRPGYYA